MPLPRSSISLSIASVRPSILATPSPISRMTPTFCLAAAVFAPAICASISCNRLLIRSSSRSKTLSPARSSPRPARCRRTRRCPPGCACRRSTPGGGQRRWRVPGPYRRVRPASMAACKSAGKGVALSMVAVCRARSSFTKPPKMRQDGQAIALAGRHDVSHHLPDAVLIEPAVHQTKAEQLLGFAFRSFADFHGYAATCLAVSSARRR